MSGMIPSILCYVPPSVELLGFMTRRFETRTHDPQFSNQIDAPGLECSPCNGESYGFDPRLRWLSYLYTSRGVQYVSSLGGMDAPGDLNQGLHPQLPSAFD